MVFRTKDAAELDDIASSVAGEIDRPTFDRVYGAAIGDGEGHPFLLVDVARRPTHASMFRRAAPFWLGSRSSRHSSLAKLKVRPLVHSDRGRRPPKDSARGTPRAHA